MISKQETLQFKGVAILIMVFLHLFNKESNLSLCEISLYLFGKPLLLQMVKFAFICVPLYLFLSGYGLYFSNLNKSSISPWVRILKLYLNFWVVFILFISLGIYLKPEYYPGSFLDIVENFTGWHTTYNREWWFLFPYMLLVLSFHNIFRIVNKMSLMTLLILISFIYITSYAVLMYYQNVIYTHQYLYIIIMYLSCLPNFVLGIVFAKYDFFGVLKRNIKINSIKMNLLWIILFICILILRIIMPSFTNIFFVIFFICWFALVKKSKWVVWLLEHLGKQSTNMWLIHTFFCYYLFHDWIYNFKYPFIIFANTVVLSYYSGLIINILQKVIIGKLLKI